MKEYFSNLFKYENWANKEISNLLLTLPEPPEKAMSLMSHIINAQIVWLNRLRNNVSDTKVWHMYSKSEIRGVLEKSSSELSEFISNITENDIVNVIEYKNTKGEKFRTAVKDILTHMCLHSPYHRGQIILLIKPFVSELPYTDYIHFVRTVKSN